MVSVPLHAAQHKDTIEYVLGHSEAKLIFIGKLDDWASQEPGIPKDIIRVAFPYENSMPASYQWADIIDKYAPISEDYHPEPDDMYSILYTSGTSRK